MATTTDDSLGCDHVERDSRTALMYAAENASPELIDYLLDAGADPSAVDSKGNLVSWYFERNARITDPAERERIAARLAGARP